MSRNIPRSRKHKLWITLTEEGYQRILIEQKRATATSPSRVTPSVIINELIIKNLPESESRPARRAAACAGAEHLGEARRGEIQ